jgi:hypothetical protein
VTSEDSVKFVHKRGPQPGAYRIQGAPDHLDLRRESIERSILEHMDTGNEAGDDGSLGVGKDDVEEVVTIAHE